MVLYPEVEEVILWPIYRNLDLYLYLEEFMDIATILTSVCYLILRKKIGHRFSFRMMNRILYPNHELGIQLIE
jgi:hypothetical protein